MTSQETTADGRPAARRSGRAPLAVLVVCVAVLVSVPLAWAFSRPPVAAGSLVDLDLDIPPAEPGPPPRPHPGPNPWAIPERSTPPAGTDVADAPRRPEVTTRSARIADVETAEVVPPVRLAIPDLGVDAPVTPVGVTADGLMEIPEDVATIGWYRHGPAPGADAGSAVLTAHVDSRTQGRGVLFDLRRVPIGAPVTVTTAGGEDLAFEVVARRAYLKSGLPARVFRRAGPPVLTLITCGGDFDAATRSYAENVVVYAAPATP